MIGLSDLAGLVSAVCLILVGIILLREWSRNYKESVFYWGFGLCVWGASRTASFLSGSSAIAQTHITSFIHHYLHGLAFVFFLLYGTLILVLKKKQANTISLIYFLAFFIINSIMGGVAKSEIAFSIWHNVLFITPPALVLGVYFYYYYRKLKKREIWVMYNLWVLFAIVAYTYTFLFAIGKATEGALSAWKIADSITIILISSAYLFISIKEKETWHAITKTTEIVIDERLKSFFEDYFFENSENIIKMEMERLNISKLITSSRNERSEFIENCIKYHFSKIASLQKQEIIRAKLLSILGVRIDSGEGKDLGMNISRM